MNLEVIAREQGYNHPDVKKCFRDALHEFNPSLSEAKLDAVVQDLLATTDFSAPSIKEKSLPEIAVGFYRACYLNTGCYTDASIAQIRYKGLIPDANALEATRAARDEIQTQKNIAYNHLDALVDAVVAFSITDAETVGKILDELSEWGDDGDPRFLDLDKKLCRHIYLYYPQFAKPSAMFKLRFMDQDEKATSEVDICKESVPRFSNKWCADKNLEMAVKQIAKDEGISQAEALSEFKRTCVFNALYDFGTGLWGVGTSILIFLYNKYNND